MKNEFKYDLLQAPGVHEGQPVPEIVVMKSDPNDELYRCHLRMRYRKVGKIESELSLNELIAGIKSRGLNPFK